MITSVQRYSLHDGDGIRVNIFLKGCDLHCGWCANPEAQSFLPEIGRYENKCIGCGACERVCPAGAVRPGFIDREACTLCGDCVYVCPRDALVIFGSPASVPGLVEQVKRDIRFLRKSGGGVTISGGEPTCRPELLLALAEAFNSEGISVAIETHGGFSADMREKLIPLVDLFLMDYKHSDSALMREYTGMGNERAEENFRELVKEKKRVIMRIPLIPGFNDDNKNIELSAKFAAELGIPLHLLPFHAMAGAKYAALGRQYAYADKKPQSPARLDELLALAKACGADAQIGG